MPIRVVAKEVRYIHELSLTLEHFMSLSSPAVPGLTLYYPTYELSTYILHSRSNEINLVLKVLLIFSVSLTKDRTNLI